MRLNLIVERLLANSQIYRDSDKHLILAVWRNEGLNLSPEQQTAFMHCSSPESIRRTRQKLQEGGRYAASEPVQEKRYLKFKQHREIYGRPIKAPENWGEKGNYKSNG